MFKNWKAICEIEDTHMRWAIALMNLESAEGKRVLERFPEYFINKEQSGPIPLSAIVQKSREEGKDFSEEYIVSNGTTKKFDIPLIEFGVDKRGAEDYGWSLLPADISHDAIRCDDNSDMGIKVVWKEKEMIMLEYNEHTGCVFFAPAELIAVDK